MPARLRAAGAIVVGKTNMPEFATEGYTSNLLFGTTGTRGIPSAPPAARAADRPPRSPRGWSPIATATDGGGSIRIPAA